jgi:uncharacterized protein
MSQSVMQRVQQLDWERITEQLHSQGFATTGQILTQVECEAISSAYDQADLYRSRVVMARHGFGLGEYKYFNYPLPQLHQQLRDCLYPQIAKVANAWQRAMGQEVMFPATLTDMLARCHAAGQIRPTPLVLKYSQGDYNCLHQDLYGEHVFPIQAAFLLSKPQTDFTGGEFVLVEQRPRMQSKPQVVRLVQGEAVIFAVNQRPKQGTRGTYRVTLRHGVSEITSGQRFTTGIIFHDAT